MAAPVIHTVGAGYTYATISAAIAAAGTVNGDVIEVYAGGVANVYTEDVALNKGLQLICMVPNQGVTIYSATAPNGNAIVLSVAASLVRGFTIRPRGTGAGVYGNVGSYSLIDRCNFIPGTANLGYGVNAWNAIHLRIRNCIARDFLRGFASWSIFNVAEHCTAVRCASANFWSEHAGELQVVGCLSAGGAADYSALVTAPLGWNVSADLTAPGTGSVTGFNTADFVNYAGNDFRISQAARLTTLARLPGYPVLAVENGVRRRPVRERVFYAGAHHCFEQPSWGVGELSGIV